jgi:hypothetical protein
MDRLWTDTTQWTDASNVSHTGTKGELLYDHLRTVFTANGRTAQLAALAVPGTPQLSVALSPSTSDVFDWVATSAGSGLTNLGMDLLAQPSWRLCVPLTPATCAGASTVYPVVGGDSSVARLQVPRSGSYVVELRSATQPVASATIVIPDRRPAIKPLPGQVQRQGSITLNGDSLVTAGNGPTGNPLSAHKWWISNLSPEFTTNSTCTAATPCTVSGSTITLVAVSATASTGSYRVNVIDADDAPANPVSVTQAVTINSGLTVNGRTGRIAANATKGQIYLDSGTCLPTVSSSGCVALDLLQGNTAVAGSSLIAQFCASTSAGQCATTTAAACSTSASTSTGCVTTGSNYAGTPGRAFLNGVQLLYTPPATYATHPASGIDSASPPVTHAADRLYYRLVRVDGGGNALDTSAWATLDIKVLARKSFPTDIVANIFQRNTTASPYPSGGSKCSTCHYSGYPGLPANALTFSTNSGATNLAASDIYLQLIPSPIGSGGTSRTAVVQGNLTRPYIDLRQPNGPTLNSTLFLHPVDLDGYPTPHAGSNRCLGGEGASNCDLTDVLTWIRDGANPF